MAKGLNPDSIPDKGLSDFRISSGEVIGYIIKLVVTRYRSLPVSCIENLKLVVDQEPVADKDITVCINGKRFMVEQLKDLWAEYWNINTPAELQVLKKGGLAPGAHHVKLSLKMRVPYVYENDAIDVKREEFVNYRFAYDDASCEKILIINEGEKEDE